MQKIILFLLTFLLLVYRSYGQDTLIVEKGMYRIVGNGLLIKDKNYDYKEAVYQLW
jgi:hypothetical protein